jgi:hypothetical protein
MKVTRCQIQQFLDAGAGVIEYAEEHVIAFSVLSQAVDLSQQMTKFLLTELASSSTGSKIGSNR